MQAIAGAPILAAGSSETQLFAGGSASGLSINIGIEQRTCPHCRGGWLRKHGYFHRKDGSRQQRYRCLRCGRTSNPGTATIHARLRKRAEFARMWDREMQDLPLRAVAARLNVHLSTAFRWRHRMLGELCKQPRPALAGDVGVTHVFIPYSEKGSRTGLGPGSYGYQDPLRPSSRRGRSAQWGTRSQVQHAAGESPHPQRRPRFRRFVDGRPTCVLLARAEQHQEFSIIGSQRLSAESLQAGLEDLIDPEASVYAFGPGPYEEACERLGLRCFDGWTTSFEQLKRAARTGRALTEAISEPSTPHAWLKRFRGVATRYLHHYMAWFHRVWVGMF